MKILSWNLNNVGSAFFKVIKELVVEDNFDMVLFQECDLKDKDLKDLGFFRVAKGDENLKLYCRNSLKSTIKKIDSRKIKFNNKITRAVIFLCEIEGKKVLFFGIHFPSKLFYNEKDQYKLTLSWRNSIQEYYKLYEAEEIILFGDFNLNPFDWGMIDPDTFHGLPVSGRYKNSLINSMWSFFGAKVYGTAVSKAPGTYKYNSRKSSENLWNVFDGVLFSKGILDSDLIDLASIKIVEKTKSNDIYKNNKILFSDHLPIEFTLKS